MFSKAGKWTLMAALGLGAVGAPLGYMAAVAVAAPKEEERHPRIHHAIHDLREAVKELKEADHDFKGHREEAVKACEVAIHQLEICLKVDEK